MPCECRPAMQAHGRAGDVADALHRLRRRADHHEHGEGLGTASREAMQAMRHAPEQRLDAFAHQFGRPDTEANGHIGRDRSLAFRRRAAHGQIPWLKRAISGGISNARIFVQSPPSRIAWSNSTALQMPVLSVMSWRVRLARL